MQGILPGVLNKKMLTTNLLPTHRQNGAPSVKNTSDQMKALVYHGPGKKAWEEKQKPVITETLDAIVRITKTTICGTDLHILKGDIPEVTDGRILGHEGVGIMKAYESFSNAAKEKTLKVILTNE